MRNIALTFLGCFTILAACSNSDDAEKPVAPVPTGDVTIYSTTNSLTRDLTRDAVNFSSKDNLAPTSITLNPTEQYQTMDGFGVAITGATCFNLLQMKPEDRHAFLTETFSDDKGFGFSYIRISIGCSDFSLSEYTCCDTKGIENFALQSEEKDYIPAYSERDSGHQSFYKSHCRPLDLSKMDEGERASQTLLHLSHGQTVSSILPIIRIMPLIL